jgi:hypothetical protein
VDDTIGYIPRIRFRERLLVTKGTSWPQPCLLTYNSLAASGRRGSGLEFVPMAGLMSEGAVPSVGCLPAAAHFGTAVLFRLPLLSRSFLGSIINS